MKQPPVVHDFNHTMDSSSLTDSSFHIKSWGGRFANPPGLTARRCDPVDQSSQEDEKDERTASLVVTADRLVEEGSDEPTRNHKMQQQQLWVKKNKKYCCKCQ